METAGKSVCRILTLNKLLTNFALLTIRCPLPEQYTGHIINPLTGIYNEQKKVTSILSDNPLDAEILSTVWMIADDQQREQINENFKHIKGTIYTL